MRPDMTVHQAIRKIWPLWNQSGKVSKLTQRVIDSLRYDYQMSHHESRECFERALEKPVDEAEFDAMLYELDELRADASGRITPGDHDRR